MFESLLRTQAAYHRHCDAPFAAERARYLQHCADHGATLATLRMKSHGSDISDGGASR